MWCGAIDSGIAWDYDTDRQSRAAPRPAIGIRASGVGVMVGLKELVVLAAVAGHRLPHCWRGDYDWMGRFRLTYLSLDGQRMTEASCVR